MSGVKNDDALADAPFVPAVTDPQASPDAASAAATHDPTLAVGPVQELISSAAEVVFLIDGAGKVVYAGQSLHALVGYDPLQIVGHPLSSLVHPAQAAPLDGAIAKALAGAKLGEAELRWPTKDGSSSLSLSVGFAPLGTDELTEGIMVTARHGGTRDIVAAALAFDDAKVTELAAASPIVVFLLDGKGRCTWINQQWTRLLGHTAESAVGLGWVNAVFEDDRTAFRTTAAQAHQRRIGWRQQFRATGANGANHWIDAAAAPRFAADGTVAGYIGFMADITAEVRSRAETNKRTTIVESNAQFVVMDERSQRLIYGTQANSAPLSETPPVPAPSQADAARPSLGALASDTQAQYLNEIRPAVLADGVWQSGAQPSSPEGSAPGSNQADASDVQPAPAPKAKLNTGQPIAWNFDAVEPGDGPVQGWQGPSWTTATTEGTGAAISAPVDIAPAPAEQVYVGLVGPSGSVESIAAVSDSVLEPSEFEDLADQLPAVDPITGLANRALFQERIRLAMHRMGKDGVSVAVMLANLHGYSDLRAQVGAKTGDDQLFVISKRLEATIRQVDTAARIGDADFAVLGVGWFFPGDVESVAKRFIMRIQEPLPSIGRQINIPASMGIAIAQADEPIGMILRRAQRARKMAAELGPGRVYVDNGPGREATTG